MTTFVLTITFVGGYLIGSVPVAYWIVKSSSGVDLREQGTSNIGAYNAFEVTGSRATGVAVGLLDALKGFLAWLLGLVVFHAVATDLTPLILCGAGVVGAVTGHNYNIWLSLSSKRAEGGKGLATAAGGLLLIVPNVLIVWGLFFLVGWWGFGLIKGRREIIPGNVLATTAAPVAAFFLYNVLSAYIVLLVALLVLPKHFRQMRDLVVNRTKTPE